MKADDSTLGLNETSPTHRLDRIGSASIVFREGVLFGYFICSLGGKLIFVKTHFKFWQQQYILSVADGSMY